MVSFMEKSQIDECHKMILKWKENGSNSLRDQLYEILREPLYQWIASISSRRGEVMTLKEIQSISWDCFEYCLKMYKPEHGIPIPNHFYSYTKFILATIRHKKERYKVLTASMIDKERMHEDLGVFYDNIEDLKLFRKLLDEKQSKEFDKTIFRMSQRRVGGIYAKIIEFILVR